MFRKENEMNSFNPDSRGENGRTGQQKGVALTHGISGIFQRLFGKTERIVVVTEQADGSRERKVFRVNKNSLNKYLRQTDSCLYMDRTTENIVPEKSAKTVKATVLSLREKFRGNSGELENIEGLQVVRKTLENKELTKRLNQTLPEAKRTHRLKSLLEEMHFNKNMITSRNAELNEIRELKVVKDFLKQEQKTDLLNQCLQTELRSDVFSNEAEEDVFYNAKGPETYSFEEGFPSGAYVREVENNILQDKAPASIKRLKRLIPRVELALQVKDALRLSRTASLPLDTPPSPERGPKKVTQDAEFFYREAPDLEREKLIQIFKDVKKKEEEQKEINRKESEKVNSFSLQRLLGRLIPFRWI